MSAQRTLGINGLGRIGKLTLWHQLCSDDFDRIVVNTGREVGTSMASIAEYISKDSTYGPLQRYLYGHAANLDLTIENEQEGILRIFGKEVKFLRTARNPREIPWRENDVTVVVDTTGKFKDPAAPADSGSGSLRGHLEAGAKVVLLSAPFKSKSKEGLPPDAIMLINGINEYQFEPGKHTMVSAASCTTTALAHMVRPLLDRDATRNMMTAGMSTIHAATNTQSVLDSVPKAGAKDLRKTRSVFNNIILTSTGAAKALEQVMPEIGRIGFMADSVRIPTSTASLIILNVTFQTEMAVNGKPSIDRSVINKIYREAATGEAAGLVKYSEEQNVSADMIGEDAAVVIEAAETHTRTGFLKVELPAELLRALDAYGPEAAAPASELVMAGVGASSSIGADGPFVPGGAASGGLPAEEAPGVESALPAMGKASPAVPREVNIPVTHVKVFGWYDNEMGSYTKRMAELTRHIVQTM